LLELTLLRLARAGELPRLADLLYQLEAAAGKPDHPVAPVGGGRRRPASGVRAPEVVPAGGVAGSPEERLRRALDERFPSLAPALRAAALELSDVALVLRLGAVQRLERDRLSGEGFRGDVASLCQQVLGKPIPVRVVFTANSPPPTASREPAIADDELAGSDSAGSDSAGSESAEAVPRHRTAPPTGGPPHAKSPAAKPPTAKPPPGAEPTRGQPGELAEKVRKRFDGLFVQEDRGPGGAASGSGSP
jgi:hypothetical protein